MTNALVVWTFEVAVPIVDVARHFPASGAHKMAWLTITLLLRAVAGEFSHLVIHEEVVCHVVVAQESVSAIWT